MQRPPDPAAIPLPARADLPRHVGIIMDGNGRWARQRHLPRVAGHRAGVRAIENRAERGQRLQSITYDEALRDKLIVGTPEMVTDRIQKLKEELGLNGVLAELNCGSLIPHERVMKSLQLLCEKVMPQFN